MRKDVFKKEIQEAQECASVVSKELQPIAFSIVLEYLISKVAGLVEIKNYMVQKCPANLENDIELALCSTCEAYCGMVGAKYVKCALKKEPSIGKEGE